MCRTRPTDTQWKSFRGGSRRAWCIQESPTERGAQLLEPGASSRESERGAAGAQVLARSRLFGGLEPEALDAIGSKLNEEQFSAGAEIFREGDEADRYYLIASGEVEILDANGRRRARLGPAEGFGEMGIVERRPRNATVRALSDTTLLSLDRQDFLFALEQHSSLLSLVEEEMALRTANRFLMDSSPFRSIEAGALTWLALRLERANFAAGEDVIRQGEPGDALYIVLRGRAEVLLQTDSSGYRRVDTISVGQAFGEQALLYHRPRGATVRALEPLDVFRLRRQDFEEIVAAYADREAYFRQLSLRRERPRRRAGTYLQPADSYWVLAEPSTARYLKLSERAAFIWDLIDGDRSVRDLTLAYFGRYGGMHADVVLDLITQLAVADFIELPAARDSERQPQDQRPTSARMRIIALSALTSRYFSLPEVDARLTWLHDRALRLLFAPVARTLSLVCAVIGAGWFSWMLFSGQMPVAPAGTAGLLAVLGVIGLIVQVLLHELAHGITCKHFGRKVHRAGIGWVMFLPLAFVDTSDAWLAPRRARILIAGAGPYTNVVLSGAAALLLPFVGPVAGAALANFAFIGYAQTLANLNPLVELDGYFVLMDWLNIPNLRRRALMFIGRWFAGSADPGTRGTARVVLSAYGLLVLCYALAFALAVIVVYRHYLQDFVARVRPDEAEAIGWVIAVVTSGLILRNAWSEVRRASAPPRTP